MNKKIKGLKDKYEYNTNNHLISVKSLIFVVVVVVVYYLIIVTTWVFEKVFWQLVIGCVLYNAGNYLKL